MQRFIHLPHQHTDTQDGFSLLELVVAVSIMLILAVVGLVAYQSYTDDARQAAVDQAANDVLTAVIATSEDPNKDTTETVKNYNSTTNDVVTNITFATVEELVIQAKDNNDTLGVVTVAGDYSHVDTTSFTEPGVSYTWVGDPHRSASVKLVNGAEVFRNIAPNPRAEIERSGWASNVSEYWNLNYVTIDDHPQGITTALQSKMSQVGKDANYRTSASLYSVGGVPRLQETFHGGVWVKSDTAGKAAIKVEDGFTDITPNEWVFITSKEPLSDTTLSLNVRHETPELGQQATTWTTGAIASYDEVPTEFFDGDTQ